MKKFHHKMLCNLFETGTRSKELEASELADVPSPASSAASITISGKAPFLPLLIFLKGALLPLPLLLLSSMTQGNCQTMMWLS